MISFCLLTCQYLSNSQCSQHGGSENMIEMHLSLPFKLAVLTAVLSAATDLKDYGSGELVRTRHRRFLLPHMSRTIYPLGILPIRTVDKSGGHYPMDFNTCLQVPAYRVPLLCDLFPPGYRPARSYRIYPERR